MEEQGWKSKDDDDEAPWLRIADGHEQDEYPGEEGPLGVIAIANAIPTMGALTSLNIRGNHMGTKGSEAMAEALRENKVIEHLDMAGNRLGLRGFKVLAEAGLFAGLQRLDLSHNQKQCGLVHGRIRCAVRPVKQTPPPFITSN